MQKAGIITKNEPPDFDEANDALDTLNAMIESWSTEAMMIYARAWETFSLVANQLSYTIGTGQNFNTTRPIFINKAFLRQANATDSAIDIIPDEAYADITTKTTPGIPYKLNYDNGFPVGIIRLWPVPSTNYELHLFSEKILSQFTINQEVLLPPGWSKAIIYNLAIELSPEYGTEAGPSVIELARISKRAIKNSIMRNRTLDANPTMRTQGTVLTGYWT